MNDAIDIAAELMSQIVPGDLYHGISTQTVYEDNSPSLIVNAIIRRALPRKQALRAVIQSPRLTEKKSRWNLDFQTALLFAAEDKSVKVTAVQDG